MAKPRLKVFRAQMGFAEAVVAAPSRKAALEAWGARQNLFAEGLADVTNEALAVEAATARPGVVLQRPIGSQAAFAAQLFGRPAPPRVKPDQGRPRLAGAAPQPKPHPRPKPDRSALTAAEGVLSTVERDAKAALADLDRRRKLLDADAARLDRDLTTRRLAAQRKLEAARKAFLASGGED